MQKRLLKKRGFWSFKHFTLIGFFAVLVLGSLDLYLLNLIPTPKVTYHGPNPITMAEVTKSGDEVLGRSTQRIGRRRVTPKPTPKPTSTLVAVLTPTQTASSTLTPPTPTVTPPTTPTTTPKPPIGPVNGEYGIATGWVLTTLSQTDLDKYFTNLQTLGVKWVRLDFNWGSIQPNNADSFNWSNTDRVVAQAGKYNINVLGTIAYAPKWAQDNACAGQFNCEPADPIVFGTFTGQLAEHYKNSVSTWEIWNEQNISVFWGPKSNESKYIDVLKATYSAIKNANPNATVITGGLAASGDDPNGDLSPITFVKNLYGSGAKGYFDEVALHPYSFPADPDYIASWNAWQQMSTIRQTMISNGDGGKKIWITEYGAPTGGLGTSHEINQFPFNWGSDYMTEAAQNTMVSEVGTYYSQNTSWMGPVFWYSLWNIGTSTSTPENFFGILRHDWSQKPAFATLKHIITGN